MSEPRIVVLTRAQRAVLGQLTHDGADNRTIASRLNISYDTVRVHMKALIKAFDAENRTQVVVACLTGRVRVRTVASRRGRDHEGERMSA